MNTINLSWEATRAAAQELKEKIYKHHFSPDYTGLVKVYGVPRGGIAVALMIGCPVSSPYEADVIVDDLVDSGATKKHYQQICPSVPFYTLYDKKRDFGDQWVVFPWEQSAETDVKENVTRLLQFIGEDVTREGLQETPKRYVKFLKEFTTPPEFNMTTFKNEGCDDMVIVKNIPFYSLCEHHLAPFFGTAAIAYIPDEKIVGLSKLPRALEMIARKPQNQERITKDLALFINRELNPKGVAVVLTARHLCVEMRGVEKPGTETVTSSMLGVFREDVNCRQEFLQLINK